MIELSIIIPVYNEEKKIAKDVIKAGSFLKRNNIAGEIILVDDGSSDKSVDIARKTSSEKKIEIHIIENGSNRGKGYSVRNGMTHSHGQYVMFVDSGHCIDYAFALNGLQLLKEGQCDIVHGSRKLPESVIKRQQPWVRRMGSKLFRLYSILFMGLPSSFTDTQCGFKIYQGDAARKLYQECQTEGFSFDIDIILRALKQGCKIQEIPVEWICDYDSRIKFLDTGAKLIGEFSKMKTSIKNSKRSQ